MIANCSILHIAMLRSIAYIRSLNLMFVYIFDKKNSMADILSKVKYICEKEIEIQEIDKDDEDEDYGYVLAINRISIRDEDVAFKKDLYRGKLREIDIYLSTIRIKEGWSKKAFKDIKHQFYEYILRDSFLWRSQREWMEYH